MKNESISEKLKKTKEALEFLKKLMWFMSGMSPLSINDTVPQNSSCVNGLKSAIECLEELIYILSNSTKTSYVNGFKSTIEYLEELIYILSHSTKKGKVNYLVYESEIKDEKTE